MKTGKTVATVVIMAAAGVAGFFAGAFLDDAMGGALLFAMIAGAACIVYALENRED